MSVEISEKLYSVPEFLNLEWPDDDDLEYELIEGRLVAKPKSGVSGEHGEIVANLSHFLKAFAGEDEKRLGRVYSGASTDLGDSEGANYVEPDVCFVVSGRTPAKFRGAIPVAPDLVVEVWSPSDTTEKIHNKVETYRQAGVRLIWSIYMLDKFIAVFSLNDPDIKFLNLTDELDGGNVLPGFKLRVSKLFE